MPGGLPSLRKHLVARIADRAGCGIVHESGLGRAICGMPAVAANACARVRVNQLPASQEYMEVIVSGCLLGDNILVAFNTISVPDRHSLFCRLRRCPCVPGQSVMRAQKLSGDSASHACSRVAVDAANVFCFVHRSQVHNLSLRRSLVKNRLRLCMAG